MYPETFSFHNLPKQARILLISLGSAIIILLLIILLVTNLPKVSADSINIENYPSSFPEASKSHLEDKLLTILTLNANTKKGTITAIIREDSISTSEEKGISSATFLVDLDAYQSTFYASITWSNTVEIYNDVFVSCPNPEESAFPETPCSDNPGSNHNLSYYAILDSFPLSNALYKITYSSSGDDLKFTINTSEPYLDIAIKQLQTASPSLADYSFTIESPALTSFPPQSSSAADPTTFLKETFSSVNCDIKKGNYSDNYYYTTLTTGSSSTYNLITYRVILEKSNNSWQVVAGPSPLLTVFNSSVDRKILNLANNL